MRGLAAVGIGILLIGGCRTKPDEIPDPAEVSIQVAQELDRAFAEGREARSWLASADNVLFQMGNAKGAEWAERLYAAGAETVKVCETQARSHGEIASTLAVGLPKDPVLRKAVFEVFNRLERACSSETSADVGQGYEMVSIG